MGSWFVLVTLAISLVVWLIMRVTVPQYRAAQNTLDKVTLLTRENYVGARVVRAFARQEDVYKRQAQGRLNDIRNVMLVGFGVKIFQALAGCFLMAAQIVIGTVCNAPVSYTHLDVYKRQVQAMVEKASAT